jgi:hypothetical protein
VYSKNTRYIYWNINEISVTYFLGNAIQNNMCAHVYVIPIILKREWIATAQMKKTLVDKEKDIKNEF